MTRGLPGDPQDAQSRWIEALVPFGDRMIRVVSLYLPNGNPIGSDKFAYKLGWMQRMRARVADLLEQETPLVIAGDFNVIPESVDAKRPQAWVNDALFQPESRAAWRALVNLGLTDATRACHPGPGVYTFWDYQAGAFQKDDGIRIDPSCCRARLPIFWHHRASIARHARLKSRPTTFPCGSSSQPDACNDQRAVLGEPARPIGGNALPGPATPELGAKVAPALTRERDRPEGWC